MQPQNLKTVFNEALERPAGPERSAYLDGACRDNTALRAQVDELLKDHDQVGRFLETSAADRQPEAAADTPYQPGGHGAADRPSLGPLSEVAGTLIGPYKLLQQIGEGGMGTVFMAEQTQPVQRKVALKVIKAGMDSRQVIARFEAERQALAMMDHINIARVIDAGATESGRPYFVMELVHGVPITKYCDDNRLTPRQRLELFVPVCQAIQHAHQKGVIHRDVKPSNVMITLYDGKPVPKVIDFGVAKATEQRLTERTLFTQYGTMVGTLEYMSPEQAEMSALGADTRSDIFSLGVLLYELLTGSTPLTRKRIKEAAYGEILRMIKEEEPPRPSTRLSDSGETLASISAQRQMEPAKLTKLVRGELDWIVMKTLEKDRNRRYETANGLAADVQRYLNDEAVQACPPSAGYRFRKFARRNKRALIGIGLLMAALVLGSVVTAWQAIRATHAEGLAQQRLEAEKSERTRAEKAEARAAAEATQAREQTQIAHERRTFAEAQERLARRRLYAAQVSLADQALEQGQLGRGLTLLEGQRPGPEQEDLRGFEWYHLWRRCHLGHRRTLPGTVPVQVVGFTPDGNSIISGDATGRLSTWDLLSGQETFSQQVHTGPINAMAVSRDGKMLASAGTDKTIRLWRVSTNGDRQTWTVQRTFEGQTEPVSAVAFSPDGTTLASGSWDRTVRIWDLATGQERTRLPDMMDAYGTKATLGFEKRVHPDAKKWGIASVAFSPDGKMLGAARGPLLQTWDLDTGQARYWRIADEQGVKAVAFSPDSKTIASGGFSRIIKLWAAATGGEQKTIELATDEIATLAFAPGGKVLALGSHEGSVKVRDLESGKELSYGNVGPVRGVAFSPDGKQVASASEDGSIKIYDVSAPREPAVLSAHKKQILNLAFSADGRTLASGSHDRTVKIWDAKSGKEQGTFRPFNGRLGLSSDGRILACADEDDLAYKLNLWDVATGKLLAVVATETNGSYSLAFSPDGKQLATGGEDDIVVLWDVVAGHRVSLASRRTLMGHNNWVVALAFSPDGQILATGSFDSTVRLWELRSGKELSVLRGHRDRVYFVAFSPDGKILATGSSDRTVKLWDVATRQLRRTIQAPTLSVQTSFVAAISPNWTTLVLGDCDGTLKVLDLATGQERGTLRGHTQAIWAATFSPAGSTLVTGSWDGTLKLWRGATEKDVLAQSSVKMVRPGRHVDGEE